MTTDPASRGLDHSDLTEGPQKIAVVLRDDLPGWQALNAAAFLTAALAAHRGDLIGQEYRDGDGTAYLATFGLPIMVYAAPGDLLQTIRARAVGRGLSTAVFTDEMFTTGNDVDNRGWWQQCPGPVWCSLVSPSSAPAAPSTRVSRVRACTRSATVSSRPPPHGSNARNARHPKARRERE